MVTKSLHEELKTKGILVAALHPGWVRTGIGGQEATLSPEESIKDCLNVLSKLSTENSGCLLSYNGEKIEWWPDLFDCILQSFCYFDWYIFCGLKKGLACTFNEKRRTTKVSVLFTILTASIICDSHCLIISWTRRRRDCWLWCPADDHFFIGLDLAG